MKKITLLAMGFMMALVVTAQNAGKDVTSLFENTDFETGDNSGWTYSPDGIDAGHAATAANYGYQGTHFMEAWTGSEGNLGDFDWSQTQDVPNGYYVVKALAHAVKQHQSETPVSQGVYLYANDQQVEVKCTKESPDEYQVLAKVTDGALTIGYRGVNCNVNWLACDYFRVIQCVGDTEDAAKTSWVKYELEELAAEFEEILEQSMSQALKDEIEESIAAIDELTTFAEADALWITMKQLKEDADACILAYEQLALKLDEVYDIIDEEGADDLYDVVDPASEKYDNGEFDAAGALAEIKVLNTAVFDYYVENADGTTGFPVTEMFVKDPSVRTKEATAGWTVNVTNNANAMPAWGHDCIEFWNCDFTLSQTIEDIPNGKYVVKVQGFYREGGNDSGANHSAGKENITAELFANNSAEKLTSIYAYTAAEMGITANLKNGYVDGLESAGLAFNTNNPVTGKKYYDDNEVSVIVMDNKLTLGVRNASTVGDRWCIFRDFQLFYYGNHPSVNLYSKSEEIKSYINNNVSTIPYAVNTKVSNYLRDVVRGYTVGEHPEDEVNAVILQLDSIWAEALEAINLFAELKALSNEIKTELLPLDYPGKSDLNAALESMAPYFSETSTVNTYANMQTLKAEVEAAMVGYVYSQTFSREEPADMTYFVAPLSASAPWTLVNNVSGWVDVKIMAAQPWIVDGDTINSGMECLNAWAGEIVSLNAYCDIANLRNGVYSLSVDATTESGTLTDQHAYLSSTFGSVSDTLSVGGYSEYIWETLTTDFVVVADGKLRMGFASTGAGGSSGWFQATNFRLLYHGEATIEDLQAAWLRTEARANEAIEILIPNEGKELVAAMEQAAPFVSESKYDEACLLVVPVVEALDSTVTATKKFYGDYYARLDTLETREGYEDCTDTHAFGDAVVALADEILSTDSATCKLFPDLNSQLQAYAGYASSLRDAEKLLNDTAYLEKYKNFVTDSVVTPQTDSLLLKLRTVEYCNDMRDVLDKAVNILKSTINFTKDIKEGDVTYLIDNPTCDIEGDDVNNVPGWTWVQGNGDKATHNVEHYDVSEKEVRFLNSWASGLNSTFYQEIIGIPDGIYRLTVAARTDGDNAYVFASTTASGIKNDTTVWQLVKNYGNTRGEIWEKDSLEWVKAECPEDGLEENFPYLMANIPQNDSVISIHGIGYGWSWHVIDSIKVTNRFLSIGFTANSELTGLPKFTGWWMSADDWKLELLEISDVQSEFDPFANFNKEVEPEVKPDEKPEDNAVDKIESAPAVTVIYDLFGRRIETVTVPGIYIVNGKKMVIK